MKVTRHENPAAPTAGKPADSAAKEVVTAANNGTHTDSKGRVIEARRLNALQYYRLTKAMGEAATSTATMEFASVACACTAIDGDPVHLPATEREVEALINRLGFEGLNAIGVIIAKLDAVSAGGVEAAKN